MKIKPTAEQAKIIRQCAAKSAGFKRVEICPGMRYNIDGKYENVHSFNIALVSDHETWNDTDVWSNSYKWAEFRQGVELTEDGRGIFDFYVYSIGYDGQLETNITAYYEKGKLTRVDGTCDGTMWRGEI